VARPVPSAVKIRIAGLIGPGLTATHYSADFEIVHMPGRTAFRTGPDQGLLMRINPEPPLSAALPATADRRPMPVERVGEGRAGLVAADRTVHARRSAPATSRAFLSAAGCPGTRPAGDGGTFTPVLSTLRT